MKIILKEDGDAEEFFEKLINRAVERVNLQVHRTINEKLAESSKSEPSECEWVSTKEAMKILGIKSRNKMQQLRDESPYNGLLISQHGRTIRYLRSSLNSFLLKYRLK